jgi:CheY-like chemotaxis protein
MTPWEHRRDNADGSYDLNMTPTFASACYGGFLCRQERVLMTPTPPGILVVDDDHTMRTLLTDLLEGQGYVVRTATNGTIALAILHATPDAIALVLLDIMMPDMNGWQFLMVQRQDPVLARIPVIALSAGAARPQQPLPYDVPFVQKPFDVRHLLTQVERVLPRPLRTREVKR